MSLPRISSALAVLLTAWACDQPAAPGPGIPSGDSPDAASGQAGQDTNGGDGGRPPIDNPTTSGSGGSVSLPCNGRAEYCPLHYGGVIQPVAHAAMAYVKPPFDVVHQNEPVLDQLRLGVQALELEVHDIGGAAVLCLGPCLGDTLPLRVVLDDVAEFLEENPRHVVTLLVDAGGAGATFWSAFAQHRVASKVHRLGQAPFATYTELVGSGERLVVLVRGPDSKVGAGGAGGAGGATFADAGDGLPAGGQSGIPTPNWDRLEDYVFSTTGVSSPDALSCALESEGSTAPLYLVNHVQSAPADATTADIAASATALNDAALVESRLRYCEIQMQRLPAFISADDIDIGGVIQVAQTLTLEAASSAPQ